MKARILLLFLCIFTVVTWAQIPTQTCSTCGKVLSTCSYKGKHPTCKECGRLLEISYTNSCPHGGNHPCSQCKKPNCSTKNSHKVCKDCQAYDFQCRYGLKHPICNTCSLTIESKTKACLRNGNHPVCEECGKLLEKGYADSCAYEGAHPTCEVCKSVVGTGKSNACKHNGNHPRCECGKLIEQQYGNACPYEGKHPVCDNCKKVIGLGTDASCQYDGKHFLDGHEWVDLGLPSGTLWATCNIGASTPEERGDNFSWGEVSRLKKAYYSWNTYLHNNQTNKADLTKYCTQNRYGKVDNKTELEVEDDAAYQLWSSNWRIPSKAQIEELIENCTWTIVKYKGCIVKSKRNECSIFIPYTYIAAADQKVNSSSYWSRTLFSDTSEKGVVLEIGESRLMETKEPRYVGLAIRPVCTSVMEERLPGSMSTVTSDTQQKSLDFTVKGVKFTMKFVEAGSFTMGATSEQLGARDNEKPSHEVTLTNDYYLGETEVTQALWKAVMGHEAKYISGRDKFGWSKGHGKGDTYPAYYVGWHDAQEFIRRLNKLTGYAFRLPTEAEWEYAAGGGCHKKRFWYSGSAKIDDVAWYDENNSPYGTKPVMKKQPNALGLYDMSGNVWEWCEDLYTKNYNETENWYYGERVVRGGSWVNEASSCRTTTRSGLSASTEASYYHIGFRLALTTLH